MVFHITYNHISIISIGWAQELKPIPFPGKHFSNSLLLFSHSVVSNSLRSMDYSMPGFPIFHYLLKSDQTHVYSVGDAIQPSHLLLSPSPPTLNLSHIRILSNRSALCIRWPKNWSLSFSISPSNEYSGLSLFRIDWLDLLPVQEISQESSPVPQFESISFSVLKLQWKNFIFDFPFGVQHLSSNLDKGPSVTGCSRMF